MGGGIRFADKTLLPSATALFAYRDFGGIKSAGPIDIDVLSAQLAGAGGPIADALNAIGIHPRSLGAALDGTTDDSTALAACIAAQKLTGRPIIIGPRDVLLNRVTHFIDYDGFHITGGGAIHHDLNDAPIFVLGTSMVRIKRPRISDLYLLAVAEQVDLWNAGSSIFAGTSKQAWLGAIYARNTEGTRITNVTCEGFHKLVFFDGKHFDLDVEVYHDDIVVAFNTAIDCTYLMTGNIMNGWHVLHNTMRGYQQVQSDDGGEPKNPHLFYKVDRSVFDARHFSVIGNVAINCTQGPAYVFRGARDGVVSGNTSFGEGGIFADACLRVNFIGNRHRTIIETGDDFQAGIESKGNKHCRFEGMIIDMRNAFGYGLRAVTNGSTDPSERYGEHNVYKDITFLLDDSGSIDRPVVEITGERDAIFENLKWVYTGDYGVYPIRMNVSSNDAALKNQRVKIINPQISKDAGSNQSNVLHVVADSTDSVTLEIDTERLNFDWADSSLLDNDGVCKLVKNGQLSGTWTPIFVGLSTAGSNSYDTQSGEWVRIGDIVFVRGRVELSGGLDSTGTIRIGGLPFPVKSGPSVNTPSIANLFSNITLSSGNILQVSSVTGTTQVALRALSNSGASTLSDSAFSSGASVEFALSYQTSAAF